MSLQDQVDAFDASIAAIDAEIADIDAETITVPGVQEYVATRRANLVQTKSIFTFRRGLVQTMIDNPITGDEQTAIDGMNTLFSNQYATHLASLINYSSADRTQFFSLYSQAETNCVRECIIKNFFNI